MSPKGTASLSPEKRRSIAQKGGLATSRNKAHMAEIGRRGGLKTSQNKEHMATLGHKGGKAAAAAKAKTKTVLNALDTEFAQKSEAEAIAAPLRYGKFGNDAEPSDNNGGMPT